MKRTVFLGTSAFAAAVLEGMIAAGERPVLVLTRPARPRGRGRRLTVPPVAETARRHDLELLAPADVNDPETLAAIAAARPDAVCVCAFGALIREPLLSRHRLLNVHPSLLPRWRGAAPVERAIMAGDQWTGVSIMQVTAGLDSGPVGLVEREPIRAQDTYGTLAGRLQGLGARLLVAALRHSPDFVAQDEASATYAEKITAADRRLDPHRGAAELDRVVRALEPHIGARLAPSDGPELGVRCSRVHASALAVGALVARDGRLMLGCGEGTLELLVVQPPGGRPMPTADYLRGHRAPGG